MRDRLLGRESKDIDIEVFGAPGRIASAPFSSRSAASKRSAKASRSTSRATSTSRCRAGSRSRAAATAAFDVTGDPSHDDRRRRPAPRLHGQRHRLGSAHRRVSRPVRRPRRSRAARAARRRSSARSATTACACCGPSSSPRASTSTLDEATRAPVPARFRSTICRPSASGASSRSCCPRRGRRSASRWRSSSASSIGCFPSCTRSSAARRNPSGIPEGDVWVHTLQVDRPGARARRRPAAAAADGRHARRRLPRLRQAGDDRVLDGRIRSIDHEEQGVAPATRLPRPAERPVASTATTCARRCSAWSPSTSSRGCGSRSATRSATARSGAWRRKSTSSCWRGSRSPTVSGASPGVFNCDAMDWFLERARALGVEHRPPAPILLGRHLLGARRRSRAAGRRNSEGGLRAAARRDGRRRSTKRSTRRSGSRYCDGRAAGASAPSAFRTSTPPRFSFCSSPPIFARSPTATTISFSGHEILLRRRLRLLGRHRRQARRSLR